MSFLEAFKFELTMNQPPAYAQGPPPAACHSKVELRISCKKLLDKDVLSKSDPLCVLFEMRGGRWTEVDEFLVDHVLKNFSCLIASFIKFIEDEIEI